MTEGTREQFLISGASGFLGRELLNVLLAGPPVDRFVLLARRSSIPALTRRLPETERITILPADLGTGRCGLGEADYRAALEGTTRILHLAAAVRFDLPLEEARRVNVGGTECMLEIAAEARRVGSLRSFLYVGTAFAAGRCRGAVAEARFRRPKKFRNTYEQSKFEAEERVRLRMPDLPAVIARPSIVIGSSQTGETENYQTLNWLLKVYASGVWRTVPGRRSARVDIVPVDYVAKAAARLALDPAAVGRTVHLCSGAASATMGEIAAQAAAFLGLPPPRFVHPLLFTAVLRPLLLTLLRGRRLRVLRGGRLYRPYLAMDMQFETAAAQELLGARGIAPPNVTSYLDGILRYCVDSGWKRRSAAPGGVC